MAGVYLGFWIRTFFALFIIIGWPIFYARYTHGVFSVLINERTMIRYAGKVSVTISEDFIRAAISHRDGFQTFYRLKEVEATDLPKFYDQLGSFSRETILSHKSMIPQLEDLLIEDNVITITFETLMKKHNMKTIDLIHAAP